MPIGDTISITYNAVAKVLSRVGDNGGFGQEYFLDDSANLMRFNLSIKHSGFKAGKPPESHLMRLDVEYLDSAGVIIRKVSSWGNMRTELAAQDLVSSQRVQAAFLTAWTATNTTKLLGYES